MWAVKNPIVLDSRLAMQAYLVCNLIFTKLLKKTALISNLPAISLWRNEKHAWKQNFIQLILSPSWWPFVKNKTKMWQRWGHNLINIITLPNASGVLLLLLLNKQRCGAACTPEYNCLKRQQFDTTNTCNKGHKSYTMKSCLHHSVIQLSCATALRSIITSLIQLHFKIQSSPVAIFARLADINTTLPRPCHMCFDTSKFHSGQLISLLAGGMTICRPPVSLPDWRKCCGEFHSTCEWRALCFSAVPLSRWTGLLNCTACQRWRPCL